MKKFALNKEDIVKLIDSKGGCIATDRITVDANKVGRMYRDEPHNDSDTGWRFFAGDEEQEYIDDLNNSAVYSLNTIANYDKEIIPYLDYPIGTELERDDKGLVLI